MTIKYASVSYTGDGTTVSFIVPFKYLTTAFVKVYLDGVETIDFDWVDSSNIRFTTPPANGVIIKIERNTQLSSRMVDFKDGSKLTEADLDDDSEQAFDLIQEQNDTITDNKDAIDTNTANIENNTTNIATNVTNIAANASNISTNAANISSEITNRIQGDADTLQAAKDYTDAKVGTGSGMVDWATGINYLEGTNVKQYDKIYEAQVTHISSDFDTDLADGKWVEISRALTSSEVKQYYESNPDTNAFTDADKARLDSTVLLDGNDEPVGAARNYIVLGTKAGSDENCEIKVRISGNGVVDFHKNGSTFWKTAYFRNLEVKDVGTPVLGTSAANKDYVDTGVNQNAADIATKVSKSGDTITGDLAVDGEVSTGTLKVGGVQSEPFLQSEKDKLALLESSRFLGTFTDLTALENAYPTANEGEYANVDSGAGSDVERYIWDLSDSKWILASGSTLTAAEVKSLYESNADTNAFTDTEKTKLAGIEDGATADQTGAEIKALYESEADTNAFTDLEKSKLDGIEDGATADQIASEVPFDPTVEGIMDSTVTDVQKAIDVAASMGGAGDNSVYSNIDGDSVTIAKWDTTSVLGATFALNTTTPLAGKKSYTYSTDTNTGAVVSYLIDVPLRSQKSEFHTIKFPYVQTGTEGTIEVELYDVTNSASIFTKQLKNAKFRYSRIFGLPSGCTQVEFRIKSVTDGVAGLEIDQISLSDKAYEYGSGTIRETITYTGYLSLTGLQEVQFKTRIDSSNGDLVKDDNTSMTKFIFQNDCDFSAAAGAYTDTSGEQNGVLKLFNDSDVLVSQSFSRNDYGRWSAPLNGKAKKGWYLLVTDDGAVPVDNTAAFFSVTATAQSDKVLFEDSARGENDFDVDATDVGVLSNFNGASDWCSLVSHSSTGIYEYALNTEIFTEYPDIGSKLFNASSDYDLITTIDTDGTVFPNFEVRVYNITTSSLVDRQHRISAKARGANRHTEVPATIAVNASRANEESATIQVDGTTDSVKITAVHTSTGNWSVDYSKLGLTVAPKIFVDSNVQTAEATKESITATGCTVNIQNSSGSDYDCSFDIHIVKSAADRSDPTAYIVHGDEVTKVNHKTTEFDTGENWIDGRRIYARSIHWTGSASSSVTLATIDSALEIIDIAGSIERDDGLSFGYAYAADASAYYVNSTGEVNLTISAGTWVAARLTIKYVK